MPRKGTLAKEEAVNIIKKAFGDNYEGYYENHHYITLSDGPDGEPIQLRIFISFPRKPITFIKPSSPKPKDTSKEDIEELKKLMGMA